MSLDLLALRLRDILRKAGLPLDTPLRIVVDRAHKGGTELYMLWQNSCLVDPWE